uniref:TIR domain-containing protein n=1 Tax=Oryctolagus cuniculus TaxID=9986 RepID=G1TZN5_RABIT|nr:toll-like receptor 12 isoform X1 [Oryctolagus cuniculus]
MGRRVLLPGLLLCLPPAAGWTASNCLVTEGSRLPLLSRYFISFRLYSSLPLLATCFSVTNLTQALEAVPQRVQGLCLSGTISVLPQDAFSNFLGLKVLELNLRLSRLLPGALRGLEQLQYLCFTAPPMKKTPLFLPPDAFSGLSALQHLRFSGPCLDESLGVRLPPALRQLSVTHGCLQDMGTLANIFPDLVQGASSKDAWTLDRLDLSFNAKLQNISSGALQGLRLGTLRLDRTKIKAAAVLGLGLQSLDTLFASSSDTVALPAELVASLELQQLHLRGNRIKRIAPEALASCHSLKTLDLGNTGLTELPPSFLATMPRLQRLNLAQNQLQAVMLCANETGPVSGLWALDMSGNGLRILPPATFSCLPQLQELELQINQLTHLEGQMFQGLQRLMTLNLHSNPLVSLGEGWLAPLRALTSLNLLNTHVELSSAGAFWGAESLQDLKLQLPRGPPGVALSLPTRLTSLELHAVPGRKPWELASNVFPVLQTMTLKDWGLQLGPQNISKILPALRQLFLIGRSLEALCSQDDSSFFLWQLPTLQSLKVQALGHISRPCRITGLPSLQELKLESLKSRAQPRPLQLAELVGELPRLEVLQLYHTGLQTLSAAAFRGLGSLQVLVLMEEDNLVLDDSLQDHSPRMPQYMYILSSSLACLCANAWVAPWLERSPRTYWHIRAYQMCPAEAEGRPKSPLFPFLQSHCFQTLELALFVGSYCLLLLLIALPLLQEARNSWVLYLQAWLRAWLQGLWGQRGEGRRFLYDVFVSHCSEDQGWVVQELLPILEGCPPAGRGLRLCLPERDFEPGKDVVDNVADSMAGSRVTLCVMSHRALHTARCRLELRLATSLVLAAPRPPVLLLIFLERISRHQLPRYHRLAWLLRRGDYCLWPEEEEKKEGFWAWLGCRLRQSGLG